MNNEKNEYIRYLKLNLQKTIKKDSKKDSKLAELNVIDFFDIFITKLLGMPDTSLNINSRELKYFYYEKSNIVELSVLIDFATDKLNGIHLPNERSIEDCECATIFMNSNNKNYLCATYLKLLITRRIFKKNKDLFKTGINIPIMTTFEFEEEITDLSKLPKGILKRPVIEIYLSTTFGTMNVDKFEILNREIYICEFEDEFICASKTKNDEWMIWIPFIPNEKTKEESLITYEKIKHRIRIQEEFIKKGVVMPIFRVYSEKSDLPLPKRPIRIGERNTKCSI